MKTISYVLNHKLYHARQLESPKLGPVIVGGYSLFDAVTDNTDDPEAAKHIDEEIIFYVSNAQIDKATDNELIEIIEREIQ